MSVSSGSLPAGEDAVPQERRDRRAYPVRGLITLVREFDQICVEADLSFQQYRMMLYLLDGPQRAGEIAARSVITKATVSIHVNALVRKGLIRAVVEERDRRAQSLRMTSHGFATLQSLEQRLLAKLADLTRGPHQDEISAAMARLYVVLRGSRAERFEIFDQDGDGPDDRTRSGRGERA